MIKKILVLISLLPLPSLASHFHVDGEPEQELLLADFTTDGCSKVYDGPKANSHQWAHCCVAHDISYWVGGSEDQRREADKELQTCIFVTTDSNLLAKIFNLGVLVGGSRILKTSFRWGYGWPYRFRRAIFDRFQHPTNENPLTTHQLQQAKEKLPQVLKFISTLDYLEPEQVDYIINEYNYVLSAVEFELQ